MTYQGRLISCNKCVTLVGDADKGEAVHVWGQEACGQSLYLPLSFAVNLKVLRKTVSLQFKKVMATYLLSIFKK